MSNQEHYARLKKGVVVWNEWRINNPNIIPDLSNLDLSGVNLIGVNLSGVNLSNVDLSGVNLSDLNLSGANLSGANLFETNLMGGSLNGANLSGANLNGVILNVVSLRGVNLSSANLSSANLSKAYLSNVDLSGANLKVADLNGTNLSKANLSDADLSDADLSSANLSSANLSKAYLSRANLSNVDLSGANLSGANLSGLDLSGLDLSGLDLSGANLIGAKLIRTQVLGTNFTGAKFTSVYLEDWNINSATKLNDIDCQYVYLKDNNQERRPSSGDFAPGEFTKLFQKALETVDLIFADGIDWKAFLLSFQELQVEYGEENLSVQAIEKKSGGAFIIRLEVPPEANKADIESQAKTLYEIQLKALEARYHAELHTKDREISIYRQHNASLENIIYTLANKPIQIDVTATSESKSMSEGSKQQFNNDLRNAQFAGGLVNADKVEAGQIGGNINNYTPQQRQNLAEAAAEIQQLLQQLEQTNPTTTNFEKTIVVAKAVDEIEKNPTLKARIIGALKSGGTEALKEAIDHPLVNILMASIEGWQEAE